MNMTCGDCRFFSKYKEDDSIGRCFKRAPFWVEGEKGMCGCHATTQSCGDFEIKPECISFCRHCVWFDIDPVNCMYTTPPAKTSFDNACRKYYPKGDS